MGKEAVKLLSAKGFKLGLADQQIERLQAFSMELPYEAIITQMNVANHIESREKLAALIEALGGVDLFIFCAGIKDDKTEKWESEHGLFQVNAIGFAALVHYVFHYYKAKNIKGQIVGLTSVLAMRGFNFAVPYCASKFFMRGYMQALRHQSAVQKLGISITDVRPGFVRTTMTENTKNMFWESTVEKAAAQIVNAIDKKRRWVYVTKRWELIGLCCKYLPGIIVNNLRAP